MIYNHVIHVLLLVASSRALKTFELPVSRAIQPLGVKDICIELASDTAEVVGGYQSSRLDRENQPHSPPCMGGIVPRRDDDADVKSVTHIVKIQCMKN